MLHYRKDVNSFYIYRFRSILKEISAGIFVEIEKVIFKIIWKCKWPRIANTIMKKQKERNLEDLHYYIARFIIKLQ